MATIKHVFTNPQADIGDPTICQPSDWNSIHLVTAIDQVTIGGNTAGAAAVISSGTLNLAGGNNLTISQAGNALTFSVGAQTQQSQNIVREVSLSGNTAGVLADITSGTLYLAGGNNITVSQNANSVTISAFNQSQQTQNIVREVSLSGNTAGVLADITSGTLYLAGGNNITLSQNANSVTISAFTQTQQTQNIVREVSLSGNTAGVLADITSGTFYLAGGNNITLSQNANSVTISAFTQTQQTQNIIREVSLSGNTAGVLADITSGTLYLAGGNNITLSQNANSITISALTESQQTQNIIREVSLSGNTAGVLADITSGTLYLAGGNNVTLSQNANSITVSAFTQTVQTQNRFNLTLSGNTVGALADVSSGTLSLAGGANITLSQAGNAITISGGAGAAVSASNAIQSVSSATGSGTNTSRFAADDHVHAGVGPAGVSNIGNTIGSTGALYGRLVLAGGNNITLSQSSSNNNAMTVTISAGNVPVLSSYQNVWRGGAANQTGATAGTLMVFPFTPIGIFPGYMTASTFLIRFSGNTVNTSSHTMSLWLAFYTVSASSTLNLVFSALSTTALAADANSNTSAWLGNRFWTLHSSLFNAQPTFSPDMYYCGILIRSSNASPALTFFGDNLFTTGGVSGTIGVAQAAAASQNIFPFQGVLSVSTASIPTTIHMSDIHHSISLAQLLPGVSINNVQSAF